MTRKHTDLSLAEIGDLYKRDHSTVLYAIRVITKEISLKATVREQLELLSRKLSR